jgi:hypothetical protein
LSAGIATRMKVAAGDFRILFDPKPLDILSPPLVS